MISISHIIKMIWKHLNANLIFHYLFPYFLAFRMFQFCVGLPWWLSNEESACQCRHIETWETRETWVRSLAREDPLEKETATHCSILAGEIPWTEKPGRLQSMWLQRAEQDLVTKQQFFFFTILCNAEINIPEYTSLYTFLEWKYGLK